MSVSNFLVMMNKEMETSHYETARNGVLKLKIGEKARYLKNIPQYITNNGELKSLEIAKITGRPLILVGPTGVSKTHMLQFYAQEHDLAYVSIDCSAQTEKGDLIGKWTMHDGNTVFSLGVIPTAIEVANKLGKCMLVFEEINALTPEAQKMINSIRDFRKDVTISDLDETYRLNQGAELLICGTMNYGVGYAGINDLNTDFKSGFMFELRGYPDHEIEEQILKTFTKLDKDLIRLSINLAVMTRNDADLEQKISPKHLVKFGQAYDTALGVFGQTHNATEPFEDNEALKQALRLTIVNEYFEPEDREKIFTWIKDIFDVNLRAGQEVRKWKEIEED